MTEDIHNNYEEYFTPAAEIAAAKSVEDHQIGIVIAVMDEWFWALERGETQFRMPDPDEPIPDEYEINRVIQGIDDFCLREVTTNPSYWQGVGQRTKGKAIDKSPEFDRLQGAARIAFVQALKKAKRQAYGQG